MEGGGGGVSAGVFPETAADNRHKVLLLYLLLLSVLIFVPVL